MFQDSMDHDIPCLCGYTTGMCVNHCPHYSAGAEFKPESVPMVELYDKVEQLIDQYKKMESGPARNAFRKSVNKVVKIANERSEKQNKHSAFKTTWWL